MAIVRNMWLRGASKSLGGAVVYNVAGRTIAREKAAEIKNPRTAAQMTQRVKWANLVNFYRANRGWMTKAFETKKAFQSEYNKFMQLNVATSSIYLTKQEAAAGAVVAGPYKVTEGSLQAIEQRLDEQTLVSNLYVTPSFALSSATTVGELSAALLASNSGLQIGDQISIIINFQQVSNTQGVPYVQVRAYEMLLNPTSAELVSSFWPSNLVSSGVYNGSNCLVLSQDVEPMAATFVLSRTVSGKTYVSTQTLVPIDMSGILTSYGSDTQKAAAIASYGSSGEYFLDSNDARPGDGTSTTDSLLYVQVDGNQYVSGNYLGLMEDLDAQPASAVFSKQFAAGSSATVSVTTSAGTKPATNVVVSANVVSFSFPAAGDDSALPVFAVSVVVNGMTFVIDFAATN